MKCLSSLPSPLSVQPQKPRDVADIWQASTKLGSGCHDMSHMGSSIPR